MSARPVLPPLVGLLWCLLSPAHVSTPRLLIAIVDRVSDGDTLIAVSERKTKLRIRLLGIEARESAHETRPHLVSGEE